MCIRDRSQACPAVRSATRTDSAWRLEVSDAHTAVAEIVSLAEERGLRILEIATVAPTLEDAFMTIIGNSAGETGP